MKYKLVKRANPLNREEVKWYASPINAGMKDLQAIAREIAGRSSLTRGDIGNVLSNFVDELPTYLKDGFSVGLGEFGSLRLTLGSEGSLTEEEFNARHIEPRVIFTPGPAVKLDLSSTHYERVHDNTPTPPPPTPAEEPEEQA